MKAVEDHALSETDSKWSSLMAAAQAGDRLAYDKVLRDCVPLVRRVAHRAGVGNDRVDDVVQETLLTIHRARQTYDPSRSFTAWLSVIAQRRAIDSLRRTGRAGSREIHAPIAYESHADASQSADVGLERGEMSERVGDAIAALPPLQREAVEQLALGDRSLAEASVATGRSMGALKVNLHRALKSLRARLGTGGASHE